MGAPCLGNLSGKEEGGQLLEEGECRAGAQIGVATQEDPKGVGRAIDSASLRHLGGHGC